LDRYPSLEAYAAAKERIFANQKAGDAAVLNLADPRVAAMRTPEGVRRRGFDPRGRISEAAGCLRAQSGLAAEGAHYDVPPRPVRSLFPGRVGGPLTIGEDGRRFAQALGDLAPVTGCGALPTAVAQARKLARAGDAVLLSAACASYEQFRNFEDRGEQFKAL